MCWSGIDPGRGDVAVMLGKSLRSIAKWFGDGLRFGPLYGSNEAWIDEVTPGWVMHDLMRVQRTRNGMAIAGARAMSLPAHPRPAARSKTTEERVEVLPAATVPKRHEFIARNR